MKIGRRGFFGLAAGAAVAGPSMAKEAAAKLVSAEAMHLGGLTLTPGYFGGGEIGRASEPSNDTSWAVMRLAKQAMRTAAQHAHYRQRTSVHHLDGDLVAARSLSLDAKVRIQRARNYEHDLNQERGYLEAVIAGWFD